ncbi:MAG: IS630 family transposase, partial [Chitinivibrionales bacterium]|nr:IS630 family transposase [Chitinivibrionales bacterium]
MKEAVMAVRYRVTLTNDEREKLSKMTKDGKTPAKRFLNARALLLCDKSEDAPNWQVADIAQALGVTSRTIEHLKKRFVED